MTLLTGLVSYWPLNEGSGADRADAHGSYDFSEIDGNVAQGTGSVYANAADFPAPGAAPYLHNAVDNSHLPWHDNPWTLAVWVRAESFSTNYVPGTPGFYRLVMSDLGVYGGRDIGTNGAMQVFSQYAITPGSSYGLHHSPFDAGWLNTWHLIVVWFDGIDTLYMRIDNEVAASSETQTTPAWSIWGVTDGIIVGNKASEDQSWDGQIGPMMAWNRVLTTQEHTDLWNGGDGLTYAEFAPAPPPPDPATSSSVGAPIVGVLGA